MNSQTSHSLLDKLITVADESLRTFFAKLPAARENPAKNIPQPVLTLDEKKRSAALMRVNHVGEVCAQALYTGQSLSAHNEAVRSLLQNAAREENDHLIWCAERLRELNAHQSYLNPVWYLGALIIGYCAGHLGDKWSLGFVAETENQVECHLNTHLEKLPQKDDKSRAILQQMCEDEMSHAAAAKKSGAQELPYMVKMLMSFSAKIMTTTSYWI